MIHTPGPQKTPLRASEILTPQALGFVADLVRTFRPRVAALKCRRKEAQARLDQGERLDFDPTTENIRASEWTVASLPSDLLDRRVEITGPVERKMIINALNSGANVFMADFEDSSCPTWENIILGQVNLKDAVMRTIRFDQKSNGKVYTLNPEVATLMVRPRGWHLLESHLLIDGEPAPASLVDFGLYFFHNALALVARGSGPYFYLPKLEHHEEAALWNDIFVRAQRMVGLPLGTIKATVLIETLPAAFQMHEILWALKEHSAGLNCGRWDYIFSFIKKHRADPAAVLPDRGQVGMDQPFMRAYTQLLVQTCHRRGVHAIGGMAAQIPIKHDVNANQQALDKVRADKEREVIDGHDGTWVAHPGLVPLARDVFDAHMTGSHQLDVLREDVSVHATDLLSLPAGTRTEAGLRTNIRVGVQYLAAWLGGTGCVPLNNLMEDAATAEISRTQIWQWRAHGATLDDGRTISEDLIESVLCEELRLLADQVPPDTGAAHRLVAAGELFSQLCLDEDLAEFLTLPAYERVRLQNPQH
jgi:malate synthase